MSELPEYRDRARADILYGCSIEHINWLIRDHPDLADLNRRFDEFYVLPGEVSPS